MNLFTIFLCKTQQNKVEIALVNIQEDIFGEIVGHKINVVHNFMEIKI